MNTKKRSCADCQVSYISSKRRNNEIPSCLIELKEDNKIYILFSIVYLEVECIATSTLSYINRVKYYLKRFIIDNNPNDGNCIFSLGENIQNEKSEAFKTFLMKIIRDCFQSPYCSDTSIQVYLFNSRYQSGVCIERENNCIRRFHFLKTKSGGKTNYIKHGFCDIIIEDKKYNNKNHVVGRCERNKWEGLVKINAISNTTKETIRYYNEFKNGEKTGLGSQILCNKANSYTVGEYKNGNREGLHYEVVSGGYKYTPLFNKNKAGIGIMHTKGQFLETYWTNKNGNKQQTSEENDQDYQGANMINGYGNIYRGYYDSEKLKIKREGFLFQAIDNTIYEGGFDDETGFYNGKGRLYRLDRNQSGNYPFFIEGIFDKGRLTYNNNNNNNNNDSCGYGTEHGFCP